MSKNNNYNHTELVWDGKFEEAVKLPRKRAVEKIVLPFQTIEVINEPREGTGSSRLFSGHKKEGWRNKLIWGDNKLVMSSLLKEYAGKINLIYIDPPFDVGTDFSIKIKVGDEEITKKPSILEEKAYNDSWGKGINSYLQMMYERLVLMRELLTENGTIYIHLDWHVGHYVKVLMDEIFGKDNFINDIAWRKRNIPNAQSKFFSQVYDNLFFYAKNKDSYIFNKIYLPLDEKQKLPYRYEDKKGKFRLVMLEAQGRQATQGRKSFEWRGRIAKWLYSKGKLDEFYENGYIYGDAQKGLSKKQYLDEIEGILATNMWIDKDVAPIQGGSEEFLNYDTQKPSGLLERVIKASSNERDLIADFFCGSGTTGAVAERLGRRWIMCDLGRFAIHTSRKRLMEVQRKLKEESKDYHPFEILNLGKYERQHWQIALSGKETTSESKKISQYIKFIIELYRGEVISGFNHIHGKKDKRFIHIGAVDAPVTINELKEAIQECEKNKFSQLDVLGWEWEMSLYEEMVDWAKKKGVRLKLFQIPREVMDKRAAEDGDVKFFELNYAEVDIEKKGQEVRVALKNFAIPSEDLIPNELRGKIEKWSDYIDYWSVDWDYENLKSPEGEAIFQNDWQTFRTKKNPKLELETPPHKYPKKGKYQILVKVIDIFGNDTSKVVEVKI